MLIFDTVAVPLPAGLIPVETQAVPPVPTLPEAANLVDAASLFSLALENETQKAQQPQVPAASATIVNTLPLGQVTSSDTADSPVARRTEEPDLADDVLIFNQFPSLPLLVLEPRWQNLPTQVRVAVDADSSEPAVENEPIQEAPAGFESAPV